MNKNILVGYSGHAFVVADAAKLAGIHIHAYTEIEESEYNPFHLDYLGHETADGFAGWGKDYGFIPGIGDNKKRMETALLIEERNEKLVTVIHPGSVISELARIGSGTFVSSGVLVNAFATIGRFAILNTGCIIEHECIISDGVHIAPGAVLAGNVTVGKRSFIGANSVVKEGVTIGDNVIAGAGSVIIRDIAAGSKVAGNPARAI